MRAQRRLGEADLVLFDALAPQDLRPLAPEARWFYVGKRAGRESMAQEAINRLMIREARRGNDVVRLKGGDPFVLGRGGEEALALAAAGIPFEVIPGVSSAVAGPALAGIPVTHRGLASGFIVVSGHAPAAYAPVLDALPRPGRDPGGADGVRRPGRHRGPPARAAASRRPPRPPWWWAPPPATPGAGRGPLGELPAASPARRTGSPPACPC